MRRGTPKERLGSGVEQPIGAQPVQYRERALKAGLDPDHTNLLQICCAECGLDPEHATCLELAAVKLGRRPGELTEDEVIGVYGIGWVLHVVE
jgi:hypothetical protein